MNKRLLLRAASVAFAAALVAGAGYVAGAQATPDKGAPTTLEVGQVMRVGDRIITAEDLIARIGDSERLISTDKHLVAPALAYLRDVALLELESGRLGLTISAQEAEACTQQQITNVKAEIKASSRGMLTYEQWLEQQGLTKEGFEAYIRERAPVILRKRVLVTYFRESTESLEAWHILRKTNAEAQAVYDDLMATPAARRIEKFEDLAVQKSIDTGSSLNKGRIGQIFKHSATLVPAVESAVWALEDGAISRPVQSSYGWHVLLRRQSIRPEVKPFATQRDRLIAAPDPSEQDFNTWVRHVGVTQKYTIERRLPGFDCKPNEKASK
ncbi:MAG: peptidylprolyl isomerase [Planctomycetes bacterium]|nr:peptidylprolyl isomerase [Planctomycetota bacterium]